MARALVGFIEKLGVGNLLGLFQIGTLPADLTKKNLTIFAQEVMPALQKFKVQSSKFKVSS